MINREKTAEFFRKTEITGFYLMLFFLPFLKVPKNLGVVLLVIGSISWRLLDKNTRFRKPDLFEFLLIGIVAAALVSTLLNWPIPKGISGLKDAFTFTMIAFVAKNNFYSTRQIKTLLWLLVMGTAIGLTWGYFEWQAGISGWWEFRRMMVAETAILTALVAAALLGVILDNQQYFSKSERLIATIFAGAFSLCIFYMGNRSGMLGFAVFASIMILSNLNDKKILTTIGSCVLAFAVLIVLLGSVGVKGRAEHLFTTALDLRSLNLDSLSANDQERFEYWKVGLAQILQGDKMIFGIGPRNFFSIDINTLTLDKPLTNKRNFERPVHAHNLYLTKTVEEGLVGLLALIALIVYVLYRLIVSRKNNKHHHWLWVACLGASVIPFIAGIFYSPFRREVAWITMSLIGFALSHNFEFYRQVNTQRKNRQP